MVGWLPPLVVRGVVGALRGFDVVFREPPRGSLENEVKNLQPQLVIVGDSVSYGELRRVRGASWGPAILVVSDRSALLGPLLQADGMSCLAIARSDSDLRKTVQLAVSGRPTCLCAEELARPAFDESVLDGLTEREREVLRCLSAGLTNRQIGERLFISSGTARTHVARIFTKLGFRNRHELIGIPVPGVVAGT